MAGESDELVEEDEVVFRRRITLPLATIAVKESIFIDYTAGNSVVNCLNGSM